MSGQRNKLFVSGIIICLIGAICFSTKAIFVKLAYREAEVTALPLLALRMIFSLPFFVVSAWLASSKTENIRFTPTQWLLVALTGCLGYYVSSLLDFLGLQYVSAGIERLVLFIYPTLVLVLSYVFFGDRVRAIQWLAVVITYFGLALAFFGEVQATQTQQFYFGSALIFGCAITYALYIILSGKLIPSIGAAKFNSYAMSFASVAVLAHYFITEKTSLFYFSSEVYFYAICMALLSTVIPSFLVTEGIKRIGAGNAAIVGSIGPVSTILQAWLVLDESISVLQIGGTVLVLAGILLIGQKRAGTSD